ncbi:hypothetical protein LEP1GSC051_1974 [Leptospira sp. P2653]|nr:hypothetical protein LEP1GSC051_1974 [Leptospira sp. P2653]
MGQGSAFVFHCELSLCFLGRGESFYIFFLKYYAEGAEI